MTTLKEREMAPTTTGWEEALEELRRESREELREAAPEEDRGRRFGRRSVSGVLVALMVGAAILFAVSRTGDEPVTDDANPTIVESIQSVRNTEPVGPPDLELLDRYLNPRLPQPAAPATDPIEVPGFSISGNMIAEPWGNPNQSILLSILDPVGAEFRAMEPTGQPNLELLESILDPVGTEFRAMEPVGRPDYETLYAIVGSPYADPVAGPR